MISQCNREHKQFGLVHRCGTYGCGGGASDGNVYEMVCTDGVLTPSTAVFAAQYMGYQDHPYEEPLPPNRPLAVLHTTNLKVCVLYSSVKRKLSKEHEHMDNTRILKSRRLLKRLPKVAALLNSNAYIGITKTTMPRALPRANTVSPVFGCGDGISS